MASSSTHAAVEDPGPPPPRFGFRWTMGGSSHRSVVFPAPGVSLALLVVASIVGAFIAGFGGIGLMVLLEITGGADHVTEATIARTLLTFFGAGFVFAFVTAGFGRLVIQEKGEIIEIFRVALGWEYQRRQIRKHEIEDVVVRASTASVASRNQRSLRSRPNPNKREIAIKTDAKVHTLRRELDDTSRKWLVQTLQFMASR